MYHCLTCESAIPWIFSFDDAILSISEINSCLAVVKSTSIKNTDDFRRRLRSVAKQ